MNMISWVCFKVCLLNYERQRRKKNPAAVMLSLGVTFGTFCTQTTPPISDVTAGVFKQCRWWRCCGQVTAQSVFLLNSHNTSCVTPDTNWWYTIVKHVTAGGAAAWLMFFFLCHSVFQTGQKMFCLKITAEKSTELQIGCFNSLAVVELRF